MPEVLLGLDIGSRNIKAVLLKQGRKCQVVAADVIKTPDGSISDGAITYMDAVAGAVKTCVDKIGVKPAGLAISVNSPDIITRNLSLPALPAAEIPSAVKFEILKFFPTIKDTHEIAQMTLASSDASVSALAVLCPRELIKTYQELAARLDLSLKSLSIRANAQASAIGRFCDTGADGGTGLLIDIGYVNSSVSVVRNGKLALSRYTMSGAAAYDGMMAEKTGIARDEFEKIRVAGDFSKIQLDASETGNVMDFCFSDICDQVRQAIELYGGGPANDKPSFISVTGEGGVIPGIEEYFARPHNLRQLDLKARDGVKTGFDILQKSGNPKILLAAAGSVLCGGGASETGINFIAPADAGAGAGRSAKIGRLSAAIAIAVLIALVSAASGFYSIYDRARSEAEIARIDAEISQDAQTSGQNGNISAALQKIASLTAVLEAIEKNSVKTSVLLEDLTAQAPESLFVTNFNAPDANGAVISGRSRDYDSVSQFALSLRQTGKYESVRINTVTVNQTASDLLTDYSFTLTVSLAADK